MLGQKILQQNLPFVGLKEGSKHVLNTISALKIQPFLSLVNLKKETVVDLYFLDENIMTLNKNVIV